MALQDASLEYNNRLINCIDIGKDAMIKFISGDKETGLTNSIHGEFLRDEVIFPLFNGANLTDSDKPIIKGVGDEKKTLKAKIDASLKLKELPQQQIIRQKFSPNQDLRLDDELFLTYDAGPGPENFCKDYTLILTPGSIIDSAGKDKSHKKQIDILSKPYELNKDILKELDLNTTLTEIKFIPGKDYKVQIKTNIPTFEDKSISFTKSTFEENQTTYFAGNATKNKYIFENLKDASKKDEIKYRILMKELGDTLQVAWLKDIILRGGFGLTADKTAICTGDSVVWLRSILNNVSCIHTYENASTFYPVAGNELQKVAAEALLKKQLRDKLDKNNKQVIKSLADFKECLRFIDVEFHGKKITAVNVILITGVLTDVIRALENIHMNFLNILGPLPDLGSCREFVANSMFKSPFRVNINKRDIEHITTFTHFLKEKKRYSFFPNLVYSLLYKGTRSITKEQIIGEELLKYLNDNPVAAAIPAQDPIVDGSSSEILQGLPPSLEVIDEDFLPKMASANVTSMSGGSNGKEDFKTIIRLNIDKVGFISYYTLIYLPEVITMAYSVLYSYNFPSKYTSACAKLFDSKYVTNITESFGKLNKDSKFDYNPQDSNENLKKTDSFIIDLYKILVYFKHKSIPKRHSIFDYCYDEIHWMFEFVKLHILPVEITEVKQGKVLDIYQDLYDAEAYLTTLNLRDQRSPVEFIPVGVKSPMKVIKGKTLKKNRKAVKAKSAKNKDKRKNTHKKRNLLRRANRRTKKASNAQMETPPKI